MTYPLGATIKAEKIGKIINPNYKSNTMKHEHIINKLDELKKEIQELRLVIEKTNSSKNN